MGPYRVEYFCPRQSPYWQGSGIYYNLGIACGWARAMKPRGPQAAARVVDARGAVVYQV